MVQRRFHLLDGHVEFIATGQANIENLVEISLKLVDALLISCCSLSEESSTDPSTSSTR